MLLFLLAHILQTCLHESIHANVSKQFENVQHKRSIKSTTWANIRIKFDYRYMDGTINDGLTCTTVNQIITWQSKSYACKPADVLNYSQIRVAKMTMENVRQYLQKLLKVIPLASPINVQNYDRWTNYRLPYSISNIDLYMAIVSRPYDDLSYIMATAGSNIYESTFYRPIQGAVFLNPRWIPSSPQNEDSKNNKFFFVIVHEIFHALGIAANMFPLYHPYEISTPYSSTFCWLKKSGKVMKFITTPYAHNFATKQFGTKTFVGDNGTCPSGIEIENTELGSHLPGRVYMTDLMTSINIQTDAGPFTRLTDASMALLQDTGNYKVTWTMGQPLVWGHPESIDGNPIKDFAIGPPQKTFPSNYQFDFGAHHKSYTGFDYKFYGPSKTGASWNCADLSHLQYQNVKDYCAGKLFYNPNNQESIGTNQEFDYIPFFFPNHICGRGEAVIPNTLNDLNILSGEYKCNGNSSFTIKIPTNTNGRGKTTVKCDSSNVGMITTGKILTTDSYIQWKYWCPPPERFCRSVALHEMNFKNNPFLSYTKQLEDVPNPIKPNRTKLQTATPMVRLKTGVNIPFL